MSKATITYLLSEEGRKQSLLAGGDGKTKQVLEVDITPELLELADVHDDGQVKLQIGSETSRSILNTTDVMLKIYSDGYVEFNHVGDVIAFDVPQTVEALIAFERDRRAHVEAKKAELQPEFDRLKAEYEKARAKTEAKKEAEQAQRIADREAREAAEKAAREFREKEKIEWVAEHGSDYLRDAVRLGYDCQRQYVTERAGIEFPEYTVDFDGDARWRSRSCPSREALAEVLRLRGEEVAAEVVWLTEEPAHDYAEAFEPCEAVVIRGYLARYDLIKIV
jgi:hypothetical protein